MIIEGHALLITNRATPASDGARIHIQTTPSST